MTDTERICLCKLSHWFVGRWCFDSGWGKLEGKNTDLFSSCGNRACILAIFCTLFIAPLWLLVHEVPFSHLYFSNGRDYYLLQLVWFIKSEGCKKLLSCLYCVSKSIWPFLCSMADKWFYWYQKSSNGLHQSIHWHLTKDQLELNPLRALGL